MTSPRPIVTPAEKLNEWMESLYDRLSMEQHTLDRRLTRHMESAGMSHLIDKVPRFDLLSPEKGEGALEQAINALEIEQPACINALVDKSARTLHCLGPRTKEIFHVSDLDATKENGIQRRLSTMETEHPVRCRFSAEYKDLKDARERLEAYINAIRESAEKRYETHLDAVVGILETLQETGAKIRTARDILMLLSRDDAPRQYLMPAIDNEGMEALLAVKACVEKVREAEALQVTVVPQNVAAEVKKTMIKARLAGYQMTEVLEPAFFNAQLAAARERWEVEDKSGQIIR